MTSIEPPWNELLGSTTVSSLTSGAADSDAGWTPLLDQQLLAFVGAQSAEFLQGYVTSDTASLSAQRAQFTATCDIKGRTTSNGWMVSSDQRIRYRVHAGLHAALMSDLQRYAVFSRTQIESETFIGAGLWGATAESFHLEPAEPGTVVEFDGGFAFAVHAPGCWEVWLQPGGAERLLSLGDPTGDSQWRLQQIRSGALAITPDTAGQWLPQAWGANHLQAVDFSKGCYLGQEVVARLQHRGESKRVLFRLLGSHDAAPGAEVLANEGRSAGVIAACAGGNGAFEALAVLRRDAQPAAWEVLDCYGS